MHYPNSIYHQLIITVGSHLSYGSCSQPQKLVKSKTVSTLGRNLYKSNNGLCYGVRKQDHITPTLKALHWLPVEKRIIFKILLMTYKTLNGLAPSYLTTIITPYHPTRKLRSSSRSTLQVPRVKTSNYGDRAFSSAAPKLWNSLPDHIKSKHTLTSFKSSLKTFLFKLAYSC